MSRTAATAGTSSSRPFSSGVYVPEQSSAIEGGAKRTVSLEERHSKHHQNLSNATSNTTRNTTSTYLQQQQRSQDGLCMSCGQRLYELKKQNNLLLKKKHVKKIPLNIPGLVERGQCLNCADTDDAAFLAHAAGTKNASSGEPSNPMSHDNHDSFDGLRTVPANSVASSNASKSTATYQGSYNDYGERDGHGTMTWDNGDVYTGEFFHGQRHGQGTLTFANEAGEYVGSWECNRQHGTGTRRWKNGDVYAGMYDNGRRTGEGRFYFGNGDMFTGTWENGVMQGAGRYYYASGQRFEGFFENGKRSGKGKLQRTDGSLDIGCYRQDVRIGLGVRWSADRTNAWKMLDGLVKKKITVAEAVALDYDIEAAAQSFLDEEGIV